MLGFTAIITVLVFALYRSEQRSTRIWIIFCIALNVAAILVALFTQDYERFQQFERVWDGGDGGVTAD